MSTFSGISNSPVGINGTENVTHLEIVGTQHYLSHQIGKLDIATDGMASTVQTHVSL